MIWSFFICIYIYYTYVRVNVVALLLLSLSKSEFCFSISHSPSHSFSILSLSTFLAYTIHCANIPNNPFPIFILSALSISFFLSFCILQSSTSRILTVHFLLLLYSLTSSPSPLSLSILLYSSTPLVSSPLSIGNFDNVYCRDSYRVQTTSFQVSFSHLSLSIYRRLSASCYRHFLPPHHRQIRRPEQVHRPLRQKIVA